jgi:hypothetical protein
MQKRPTIEVKETYYIVERDKRGLLQRQKSPTIESKEAKGAYYRGKRALL